MAPETNDSTIFNALTLLVVLGTSLITQLAGLSLALGAFLAGLLLAETEYHLQVRLERVCCSIITLLFKFSPRLAQACFHPYVACLPPAPC